MKLLYRGDPARFWKYAAAEAFFGGLQTVALPGAAPDEEVIAACPDAELIVSSPIFPISGALIAALPRLRMIQSEGVAFNCFDLDAARARHIYVCNAKACNAVTVAEQAILLMLGLMRSVISCHEAVLSGNQMPVKQAHLLAGDIHEFSEYRVGLVGFGDIARATADRLHAFGAEVFYWNRSRRSPEEERAHHVRYLPLEELSRSCDIVSLHLAVTDETAGLVDEAFLARMKPTALLINTARGELVDNAALRQALIEGRIAGAGIDTLAPEPVGADNPLVDLPPEALARVLYSPHIGGNTGASFRRAYAIIARNLAAFAAGQTPAHWVNPW